MTKESMTIKYPDHLNNEQKTNFLLEQILLQLKGFREDWNRDRDIGGF